MGKTTDQNPLISDVNLKLYEIVCFAYDVGVTPNPTDKPTFL